MLDVFKNNAFSTVSLTDAVLKRPYQPGRIGKLGLFRERGIMSTTAVVELKDGRLSLIETSPRGAPATTIGTQRRRAVPFLVPHLVRESNVMADQVQGIRSFGSENALEAVQELVNDRLTDLRAMHEVTLEFMRVGAIKGTPVDADGTTPLFDPFTAFGVSQTTATIDLTDATLDVRDAAVGFMRQSEDVLGGEPVTGYRAFCGNEFFDAFIKHPNVVASLQFQESALLRTDVRAGFEYGGITWENYRGRVPGPSGNVDFFESDKAYVVPTGTTIFATYFAPADFIETVNTIGLPIYAKQVLDDDLQQFVRIHTQSNPLALCLRPDAVVEVTAILPS